jgi:hypothetical protein
MSMAERTRMSAKKMPVGEMADELSDSGLTMPVITEAMPETTTRGSETGQDMPHADMTRPGSRRTKEMPASEMADEKSDIGTTIPG